MGFWTIALLVVLFAVFTGVGATLTMWYKLGKSDKKKQDAEYLGGPREKGRDFARRRHGEKWREGKQVGVPCSKLEGCESRAGSLSYGHAERHDKDCRRKDRWARSNPTALMSYRQLTAENLEEATKGFDRDQLHAFQEAFEEQYAILVDRSRTVANIQHSVSRMERELKHTEEAYKELE